MTIPLIPNSVLTNIPVQGEMLDENNHLTQAWRLFFQGLYTRIGGQTAPTNAVLGAVGLTTITNVSALTVTSDANTPVVAGLGVTSVANATTVAALGVTTTANTASINTLITATNTNTASIAALNTKVAKNIFDITAIYGILNAAPAAVIPVTVGASPFTFKALVKGAIAVSGGTVQSIQLTRDGVAFYNVGLLDGIVSMSTNDSVLVAYTLAPVMTFFPT